MPDWTTVLKERGLDGWRVVAARGEVVSPDGAVTLMLEEAQRPRRYVEHLIEKRGRRGA